MYEDEMFEEELYGQGRTKKNRDRLGKLLVLVQGALTAAVMLLVFWLDMLPLKYVAAIGGVLVILWMITLMTQSFRTGRGVGKVYALLMISVLSLGIGYLWKTNSMLGKLTDGEIFDFIANWEVESYRAKVSSKA